MFLNNYYRLLWGRNYDCRPSYTDRPGFVFYDGSTGSDYAVFNANSSNIEGLCLFMTNNSYNAASGSIYYISNNTNVYFGNSSSTPNAAYFGVIIGDGDTAPEMTDYCLSGNQITDFSATTAMTTSYADGKLQAIATYNITNTGASAFTIKEIGITRKVYNASKRNLIARSLLSTPVTINPSETGVVTYKIEIA